jgi:hypothetical protein
VVTDKALEKAFYRALREVSIEYINGSEDADVPAAITFVDTQLDYPLQLTTSSFSHVLLRAAQGKVGYLLQYQAKNTAGVTIPIGGYGGEKPVGRVPVGGKYVGSAGGDGEIPGDGGMMLCPVNKDGLEFMYGALAIATTDENGQLRVSQDGADIQDLHDRILELTYTYYGSTPDE